ncbi:MAG: sigma factor [Alistipes indistinctus]
MYSESIRSEFEKLYIDCQPRLLAYVQHFINDISVAQDLVQDSFMSLWDKQISFNTEETRRLLFVATRHRCINYLKHKTLSRDTAANYKHRQKSVKSVCTTMIFRLLKAIILIYIKNWNLRYSES